MTQLSKNYAIVLYESGISSEVIEETREIFKVKELAAVLASPVVSGKSKHNIVEKIFPREIHNFLKVLCDYNSAGYIDEIFTAYDDYVSEQEDCVEAELICVEAPDGEQKKRIEQFLMGEYGKSKINLTISMDDSLIGGFVIKAYDREYDWSLKARISQLAGHLKKIN